MSRHDLRDEEWNASDIFCRVEQQGSEGGPGPIIAASSTVSSGSFTPVAPGEIFQWSSAAGKPSTTGFVVGSMRTFGIRFTSV